MTLRKTKIVATLGPSSSSEEMLARMITAGVNVVRLNFSHGNAAEHIQRAEMVRAIAAKPVSYTHLDVYKRQFHGKSLFSTIAIIAERYEA